MPNAALISQMPMLPITPISPQTRAPLTSASPAGVRPVMGSKTAKLAIVDDEPLNIKIVQKHLRDAGYVRFATTSDPWEALPLIGRELPDLVLLDMMMPEVSGLDILRALREDAALAAIPVIIVTAMDDRQTKADALNFGATDLLTKPVDSLELIPRVRNVLAVKAHQDHLRDYAAELERQVRLRTAELARSRQEIIHCLGRAAEIRDNETGRHVIRVGKYVGLIARNLGLDAEQCELLEAAAPLHDVGKLGVPDEILLKPGKLTPAEVEVMQRHAGLGKNIVSPMSQAEMAVFSRHTQLGATIMDVLSSPVLKLAATIAQTHHEKWDGSGYPLGLRGEDIPLAGRITAVADVFDALSSRRPYKPAFPLDKCFAILEEGRGQHFDPQVLDAFLVSRAEIVELQIEYADAD